MEGAATHSGTRNEWIESDFPPGLRPPGHTVKFMYTMTMLWAWQAHAAALGNGAGDSGKLTSVLLVDVTSAALLATRCLRLSGVEVRNGLPMEHL